MFFLWPQLKK